MRSPRTLLKAWDMRPKKSLGQNFLLNEALAQTIVDRAKLRSRDLVIEIGAGLGAITIPAARRAARVIAVEKDPRLLALLRTELAVQHLTNVELVNQDVLRTRLRDYIQADQARAVVLGNLPYNLSSQIIVHLIASRAVIDRAVIMLQKEMAQRLAAPPGGRDYGRLSVMLQYCAEVDVVADAPARLFYPRPKVDSQVIQATFRQRLDTPAEDESLLARVVKAGFSQRRKTLRNALSGNILKADRRSVEAWLEKAAIDPRRRAETLAVEDFVRLANLISRET